MDVNFNIKDDFHPIGLDGDVSSRGCPGAIAFGGTSRSDLIVKVLKISDHQVSDVSGLSILSEITSTLILTLILCRIGLCVTLSKSL